MQAMRMWCNSRCILATATRKHTTLSSVFTHILRASTSTVSSQIHLLSSTQRCNNHTSVARANTSPRIHLPKTHMDLTGHLARASPLIKAKVIAIEQRTPTVRTVNLHAEPLSSTTSSDENPTFLAGQWVDFHIPSIPVIGGYSICSTPKGFQQNGFIQLAVKSTQHPPAIWVHNHARIGDEVSIQFGGTFLYDPNEESKQRPVILLAAGVGINPCISVLRTRIEEIDEQRAQSASRSILPRTALLFSARSADELLFREEIEEIANQHSKDGTFTYILTTTNREKHSGEKRNHDPVHSSSSSHVNLASPSAQSPDSCSSVSDGWKLNSLQQGRINESLVSYFLTKSWHGSNSSPVVFMCGPPAFLDDWYERLVNLKVNPADIRWERWW